MELWNNQNSPGLSILTDKTKTIKKPPDSFTMLGLEEGEEMI
jgi:hypothetical protein